jgi:hypothetical protein
MSTISLFPPIGSSVATAQYTQFGGPTVDAFGRLRVSQPYTVFDSKNRFVADAQFAESLAGSATITYTAAEAAVNLNVTTASGDSAVRQSFRVMPYQPGKGLLILATFVMAEAEENLRQRVGYFNADNGIFFQLDGTTKSFVVRSSVSGSPVDTNAATQANWNGDKLDGTGPSGITLDLTKSQIFWTDIEWLGVGNVRCGFIINGQYIVCHTFQNANLNNTVYMTTAVLPVRYEITTTGLIAGAATLKQICSSVVSEGGYEQIDQPQVARRSTSLTGLGTTFVPLISIRLASTAYGAVVLPRSVNIFPASADDFEFVLVKNPTLTGAPSWSAVPSDSTVEFDVAATGYTGGDIVEQGYLSATNLAATSISDALLYNWDLQLGVSLAPASDIYTLGIRTLSGTGDAIGAITYWNLTV